MSSSDNTAHVFIDTNVALHYRRMDEIDWRQLTGADKVVIVITPVFFRELDKQKVTNKSEKIRDRSEKNCACGRALARAGTQDELAA